MKKKLLLVFMILFIIPGLACSTVIFEDDFDDDIGWTAADGCGSLTQPWDNCTSNTTFSCDSVTYNAGEIIDAGGGDGVYIQNLCDSRGDGYNGYMELTTSISNGNYQELYQQYKIKIDSGLQVHTTAEWKFPYGFNMTNSTGSDSNQVRIGWVDPTGNPVSGTENDMELEVAELWIDESFSFNGDCIVTCTDYTFKAGGVGTYGTAGAGVSWQDLADDAWHTLEIGIQIVDNAGSDDALYIEMWLDGVSRGKIGIKLTVTDSTVKIKDAINLGFGDNDGAYPLIGNVSNNTRYRVWWDDFKISTTYIGVETDASFTGTFTLKGGDVQ